VRIWSSLVVVVYVHDSQTLADARHVVTEQNTSTKRYTHQPQNTASACCTAQLLWYMWPNAQCRGLTKLTAHSPHYAQLKIMQHGW